VNPDKSKDLVGPDGQPLSKTQTERETLEALILSKNQMERETLEALIKAELVDAKLSLQTSNKHDLHSISDKEFKPKLKVWKHLSAVGWAIVLIEVLWHWFGLPDMIRTRVDEYVRENLVGPNLTNTVERVISNETSIFVVERMKPLESKTGDAVQKLKELDTSATLLKSEVSKEQKSLRSQQADITEQQSVQKLLVEAKGNGSLAAFKQLKKIAEGTNELSAVARAAVTDIDLFFDSYRHRQYVRREFIGFASHIPVQLPVDVVVATLRSSDPLDRETAATRLYEEKKANTISHLCEAMSVETNLFALALMTRAINEIVGFRSPIEPLATEAVADWWNQNKDDPKFKSAYLGVLHYPILFTLPTSAAAEALPYLTDTIQAEPSSWGARCLRADCYTMLGRYDEAEKDLAAVEQGFPNYGVLYFNKAVFLAVQNKTNVVEALNRALELQPELEKNARQLFSKSTLADSRIRWPGSNTNSAKIP
jgi:tetratricopeptide (TPR) repeat protein